MRPFSNSHKREQYRTTYRFKVSLLLSSPFTVFQSHKSLQHIKFKSVLVNLHYCLLCWDFPDFCLVPSHYSNSPQLSLPERSIFGPTHQKESLLVPLSHWISTLSLSFSKINFLCLLFNWLFLTSLHGFQIHENRGFVYFATSPARNNGWHAASA